ncbi:MAG: nitric oxide synthase oxygenase [Micromonosporaceae bacterium]
MRLRLFTPPSPRTPHSSESPAPASQAEPAVGSAVPRPPEERSLADEVTAERVTAERVTAPRVTAPPEPVDPGAAEEFLRLYHAECPVPGSLYGRLRQVQAEIADTGTYRHTSAELTYGARVAWRHASRCIGRLYWRSLRVRDRRRVREPDEVAKEAAEHLRFAGNGGRIRPTITVFASDRPERRGPRIWNEQLIRYAGYRQSGGTVLGDPRYAGFTDTALRLGWRRSGNSAERGRFDVLPLVIDDGSGQPRLYELPDDVIHEVPITHPEHDWFGELGLRWHAVPAISNMCLEIGGVCYAAAPFNGWYMGTEIGARNLADQDRYDQLPEIASRLSCAVGEDRTLWRDRALVELNIAVLHSYDQAGVTIADHHTESQRFLTHLEQERRNGREVPADWSWIVPPISGAATPVFHRYYHEAELSPGYVHHADAKHRALGCPHPGPVQ